MQRDHRASRALALMLLLVLIAGLTAALQLLFVSIRASADDTGWRSPSSDNATVGDGFEINPQYAYANDNVSAENHGGLGDSHIFYNFGLVVPIDATVKGIEVRLDWYLDSDIGVSSLSAEMSWNGGTDWTAPISDTVLTTIEHTAYLGGSSDNWGRSWTPTAFTDGNFRVRITCNSDTAGRVFYLEYVSVMVYYSPVHHLEVTGNGSMTAGGSNVLSITARDTLGDIAVNYGGAKSLIFSGPGQAPGGQLPTVGGTSVGNPVSVTFTNGVSDNATATTLVAYRSETTTVHVTDGISDSYTNGIYGLGLTVNAGSADHIVISPDTGTITAGSTQAYTAQSFDQYDNPIGNVTSSTTFGIDVAAGGSWAANVYTSEKAGTWTVTGTYSGLSDSASLDVTASTASYIVISPDSAAITAGNTQAYTAQSFDQYDNPIGDVTSSTTFGIDVAAGGSWAANVYTSEKAGTWTVTGTYSGLSDSASLDVTASTASYIIISPDSAAITAGNTQSYTAQSFDQFSNLVGDITSGTTFTTDVAAGGNWIDNTYTSEKAGTWTVTGTYSGLSDSASLDVAASSASHIVISPDSTAIAAGNTQSYAAQSFDQFGNLVTDVTADTVFSIAPAAGGSWAANVYTSEKAGTWTVTGTYSTFSDDASLTVNAGPLHHIIISPDAATITAGDTQAYTAQSIDQFDNPIADVTSSTAFSIQAGAGGSWAANVYTSANAGAWTVTGTYLGLIDTASLTVNAGSLHHIVISPDTGTITAGDNQTYTAEAFDQSSNSLGDVTAGTFFSTDVGAGGTWAANVYTSAKSGTWTVTGSYSGFTDTASLVVNPGAPHHIIISPDTATVIAGNTQAYAAQSFDQFDNPIADVTATTIFSIDLGAGGSWAGNVYTSQVTGTWTVTGTYGALTDAATLDVVASSASYIIISPDSATVTAGNTQSYSAQSFDQFSNLIGDITGSTVFSITPAAGGGWNGNIYTSANTGTWTVTGTYTGLTDTASLTVNAGPLHHIVISPETNTITAGNSQSYTSEAFDQFGNTLGDVTGSTTFGITSGAGGSWAANVYTSATAGIWTVTGTYSTVSDTASLTVNAGALHHIVISPGSATIQAGNSQAYSAQSFDQFNNPIADVTGGTTFSIAEAGHGGSWADNTYTSAVAGTWTVTGTYLATYTDTASLTVTASTYVGMVISTDNNNVIAGGSRTYTALAYDNLSNYVDVTASTVFSIDLGAGGSWAANVYTSAKAGTWTVTGVYNGFSDTDSLIVSAGPLHHIVISPDTSSITAGNPQTYIAQSFDEFDNPLGDVTTSTSFSIDGAGGGTWAANVYTSQFAGTWTVTGTYLSTYTDTAILTVSAGASDHIVISPDSASIIAGNPQTYTARSFDQFNNLIADVTGDTAFSIDVEAGGSWVDNVYTSQFTGTWTVTGTYLTTYTDTGSLTVSGGSVHHIVISPDDAAIIAGSAQAYTAQSFDQFNNPIADITATTVFSIDAAAGGSWIANVYVSEEAGTWTVTGTYNGFTDTASLTVSAGALHHIVISPDTAAITAGDAQVYTAEAFDQFDNTLGDVTGSTVFSIDLEAGGFWAANVYTSEKAGAWIVTGTYSGLTDTASLTVSAGAVHHIIISPDGATINAGSSQAYMAQTADQFDNPITDVTDNTTFSIDLAAGGTWTANVYTSSAAGAWTVSGDYGGLVGTTILNVISSSVAYIVVSPDNAAITAGDNVTYTAQSFDEFGNPIADVTDSTVFSIDLAAGGTWIANVYTSEKAGTWTVTGDCVGLTDNTSLTISAGARQYIIISPDDAAITAGTAQAYTAEAFDLFDNSLGDATSSTFFTIESGAGGSWSANVYTSQSVGTWIITGTDNMSLSDTATLTVNAGAINYYVVMSDSYDQEVSIPFTVTVAAYDAYGNMVAADGVAVTMGASVSGLIFDGNGNGEYGEVGDDVGLLLGGILDIQAKAKSAGEDVIITATDGTRMGMSEPYSIGDFRCFIATAAYGTPMIDQIQVLRDFRDQYLMKTPAGRWLVSTYYRCSPPPARFISSHDSLRALVRVVLTPIIWLTSLFMNTTLLQKIAFLASMLAVVAAATFLFRRLRRSPTP